MYKEFVFDLREAAAVWYQGNTDTTEGELASILVSNIFSYKFGTAYPVAVAIYLGNLIHM